MNARIDALASRLLRPALLALALVAAQGLLAGCRGQPFEEPPVAWIRNMHDQPRYDPQEHSRFFADGRTMRHLVPGVVAAEMETDLEVVTGRLVDDSGWVLTVPDAVVERREGLENVVERGQERYGIYCTPCHGFDGAGNGMVVQRGMLKPPSLHDPRILSMPDGQLYATITNGIRNMPAYQHSVPLDDRWAIVAYVRALQLSQASAPQAMNLVGGADQEDDR